MNLITTITDVNVPSIPGDLNPETDDYLSSVYQNSSFAVDITFSLSEEVTDPDTNETSAVPIPITSVIGILPRSTVNTSIINTNPTAYKVRVSGTFTDVIGDDFYRILVSDSVGVITTSTVNVPAEYLALVGWIVPSIFWNTVSYSFNINSGVASKTFTQYVYWNFEPGITNFTSVLNQGTL
jgi:hypothetical protein